MVGVGCWTVFKGFIVVHAGSRFDSLVFLLM